MSRDNWRGQPASRIRIDVTVPVLNEAHVLRRSIERLYDYFASTCPYRWRLLIAENGSTDGTAAVAREICAARSRIDMIAIDRPGRGRALRTAWSGSEAEIVAYTDVDLSTDLAEFPKLFGAIVEDGHDLAVGSRLAAGARTTRSFRRQIVSRAYNALLRQMLDVRFSDAQTGFKAVTREVVDRVLPLVEDESWFLDTELLVLAERLGYRIADVPVTWVEDDDSRVRILRTAWEDWRGILRLRRTLRTPGALGALPAPAPRGCDR